MKQYFKFILLLINFLGFEAFGNWHQVESGETISELALRYFPKKAPYGKTGTVAQLLKNNSLFRDGVDRKIPIGKMICVSLDEDICVESAKERALASFLSNNTKLLEKQKNALEEENAQLKTELQNLKSSSEQREKEASKRERELANFSRDHWQDYKQKLQLEFNALHTELAGEQLDGAGAGTIADEILSEVSFSAFLNYQLKLNPELSLRLGAGGRLYSYIEDSTSNFAEDQQLWAGQYRIGAHYQLSMGLGVAVDFGYEDFLYYQADATTLGLGIETDSSFFGRGTVDYSFDILKVVFTEPFAGAAYKLEGEDLKAGWGYFFGARLGLNNFPYLFVSARYEQNFYKLKNTLDLRQENFEIGLQSEYRF